MKKECIEESLVTLGLLALSTAGMSAKRPKLAALGFGCFLARSLSRMFWKETV